MTAGRLVSTRDLESREISYADALLEGLAPDGGLYTPTSNPHFSLQELKELKDAPYTTVAYEVKRRLIGGAIPDKTLHRLVRSAYSLDKFPHTDNGNVTPIRKVGDNLFIQNLSLGPTAAFKDMALQQLAQEMNFELNRRNENLIILGATSGDTGSSAEAAFKGLDRVTVFMLSPRTGMSDFQRAQMGILTGDNIYNISVDGVFDDCQDLVKLLKRDPEFAKLGAVNSINWGRISSQIPYYFSGYLQAVSRIGEEVDFIVPSGNFGNVLSGYRAKKMGLPIRRLIIATNENNVLERLINTGVYESKRAQVTSSPSMDISKASNYERLVFELLNRDPKLTSAYMEEFERTGKVDLASYGLTPLFFEKNGFYASSSTHKDRLKTIRDLLTYTGGIIDTHTADALKVALEYNLFDGVPMIVMETALPVKFEPTIKEALGFIPPREERFNGLEDRMNDRSFHHISRNPNELKEYIKSNVNP